MLRPGATLGVLGGGQLARMIGLEAVRMGYRLAVLDPSPQCSARRVADELIEAPWDDGPGIRALAERSDVVTLDTEHIPWEHLVEAEAHTTLNPSSGVLRTVQDRARQKAFLVEAGLPTSPYHEVASVADLEEALDDLGRPAVMKTRTGGYDGKGQVVVRDGMTPEEAWQAIDARPSIIEAHVPFQKEVSVVLARGADDAMVTYPLVENVHRDGILHTSRCPATVEETVASRAREVAEAVAVGLGHRGVMAVELFVVGSEDAARFGGERVLVNEIAPRVHNSGHLTQAAATSQFEQHLRAVCGLPLGDATLPRPTVMLNLLGDLWGPQGAPPAWDAVLGEPHAKLHLYEKTPPRIGRKMGHINITHDDGDTALAIATRLHEDLMARASKATAAPR